MALVAGWGLFDWEMHPAGMFDPDMNMGGMYDKTMLMDNVASGTLQPDEDFWTAPTKNAIDFNVSVW